MGGHLCGVNMGVISGAERQEEAGDDMGDGVNGKSLEVPRDSWVNCATSRARRASRALREKELPARKDAPFLFVYFTPAKPLLDEISQE
jgi:hypothetical protein